MKEIKLPLSAGWNDRGMGHGDYAVLDASSKPVIAPLNYKLDAEYICKAVNSHEKLVKLVKRASFLLGNAAENTIGGKFYKDSENLLSELEE